MKKSVPLACCILLCFCLNLHAESPKPNTLSPAEKAEGFQLLFDGKKLSPKIWQSAIDGYPVENGTFVCQKGGNLLTAKEYGDFVFRFEFLLPPGANNGLGIRTESPLKDSAYHGMELQILDNSAEKYQNLKPYQFHGSVYGVFPSKRDAEKNDFLKPTGQWNYQEVTACGSKITVVLNGETILQGDLAEYKDKPTPDGKEHPGLHREKGFLGFLGHGDPVRFRNVRVKELNALTEEEKKQGYTLLFDGKELSPELWAGDIQGYPVEDGAIVCRGKNVSTKEKFENFSFRFEFQLPPGGNNGIGFRLPTPESGGAATGFECQILDHFHEKYKDLLPYQFHGSLYFAIPAKRNPEKNDYLKPVGQWNYTELTNKGSRVRLTLNGKKILDVDLDEYKDKPLPGDKRPEGFDRTDGHVGFQGHRDPVRFRNIRIKKL